MNKVTKKTPRYFDLFKTQHEFYSASLDENFFKSQIPQYADTWKATRKGCLRLLLSHYDCPPIIRDQYKKHPHVEVRYVAFFGYISNTKFGSNINYVLDNEKLILEDRAKTIRITFLEYYSFIKLIKIINPNLDFPFEKMLLNFPSDNIYEVFTILSNHLDSTNLIKVQLSEYINLILNHQGVLSFKQVITLQELVLFLINPTSGLISSDLLVRDLALRYFHNKRVRQGDTE